MAVQIPDYTKENYLESTSPYEFLYAYREDRFTHNQLTRRMAEHAKSVGVTGFTNLYKDYLDSIGDGKETSSSVNYICFPGQELDLQCGEWEADEFGIRGKDPRNKDSIITACPHPIMPVQYLQNVDTLEYKVKLAFFTRNKLRHVIIDKSIISDSRSIINLSRFGIMVNSETSRHLVRFLAELEELNSDIIPTVTSVGRLGWIEEGEFSPYAEQFTFDGEEEYRSRFESVQPKGKFKDWLNCVHAVRAERNIPARIALAASFASVLIAPCNCLPFFVHIWGGSGTGKTVSLMLAASVWANPEIGKYIQTFNATDVGKELGAAFCNSMPLIIDELQMVKDARKDFDRMIYQLSEGVGRARGRKTGGVQKVTTWRNCILTTGEFPIISSSSGAGAVSRTIEIDVSDTKLFSDPQKVVSVLNKNYGFAGKLFVEKLLNDDNLDRARTLQDEFQSILTTDSSVDKQTASAALILTADQLIDEWIFQDGIRLAPSDLSQFLSNKDDVDQNARTLEFLYNTIAMHQNNFDPDNPRAAEIWGTTDEATGYICIIKSKFDEILNLNGFNSTSFLTWAKRKRLIEPGKDGKSTRTRRLSGVVTRCVYLKYDFKEDEEPKEMLP